MRRRYFFVAREIRNSAGNSQYALVRAGGQVELFRRLVEHQPAVIADVAGLFE
jgi:hypothetical protein